MTSYAKTTILLLVSAISGGTLAYLRTPSTPAQPFVILVDSEHTRALLLHPVVTPTLYDVLPSNSQLHLVLPSELKKDQKPSLIIAEDVALPKLTAGTPTRGPVVQLWSTRIGVVMSSSYFERLSWAYPSQNNNCIRSYDSRSSEYRLNYEASDGTLFAYPRALANSKNPCAPAPKPYVLDSTVPHLAQRWQAIAPSSTLAPSKSFQHLVTQGSSAIPLFVTTEAQWLSTSNAHKTQSGSVFAITAPSLIIPTAAQALDSTGNSVLRELQTILSNPRLASFLEKTLGLRTNYNNVSTTSTITDPLATPSN